MCGGGLSRAVTPHPDYTFGDYVDRPSQVYLQPGPEGLLFLDSGGRVIQERRRTPRYRLDATIAVAEGTGRAIDLSSNSVYFEFATPLTPGDSVPLVFPLETGGSGGQVQCTARVVRVDPRGDAFGIAATYEPVVFSVSGAQ